MASIPSPAGSSPARPWIGVDIGGSAVKLGSVASDGGQRRERALPLGEAPDARAVLAAVGAACRELAEGLPTGVGVGIPGLFERPSGRVLASPNLPWLEGVRVADELAESLGLPSERVRVENDANVAALGEQWLGAAAGARHVLVVTLGTGIGGGLILGGELVVGEGLAGELGHVVCDPGGEPCSCGSRGCLETLASARAARRRALERGLPAEAPGDLERLAERARSAPGPERALLESVGRDLGHGLAIVLNLLDVRTFVVGGGFSAALDVLEPGIRAGLREWAFGERVSQVHVRRATLGNSAGWIGAARLLAP